MLSLIYLSLLARSSLVPVPVRELLRLLLFCLLSACLGTLRELFIFELLMGLDVEDCFTEVFMSLFGYILAFCRGVELCCLGALACLDYLGVLAAVGTGGA